MDLIRDGIIHNYSGTLDDYINALGVFCWWACTAIYNWICSIKRFFMVTHSNSGSRYDEFSLAYTSGAVACRYYDNTIPAQWRVCTQVVLWTKYTSEINMERTIYYVRRQIILVVRTIDIRWWRFQHGQCYEIYERRKIIRVPVYTHIWHYDSNNWLK